MKGNQKMSTQTTHAVTTGIGPVAADEPPMVPIVIDLGKTKKKRIKDLKRGHGRLMAELATVIDEVRGNLGEAAGGQQLVPVVIIYKEKRKRKKSGRSLLFPFL
jgi:hypothetical protein